jgi:large exoprotein involved in heme utilization and adhesion
VGQGGNVDIQAGSFSLDYGSSLLTDTQGQGDSGNILVRVNDFILVRGSRLESNVLSTAIGQGGDINIEAETGSISLTGGTSIDTSTFGRGDAGDVVIQANDSVSIEGSFIQTRADSDAPGVPGSRAAGNGGDIIIKAESLSLSDLSPSGGFIAVLSTSTNAGGNAGDVLIQVNDIISLTTSVISAAVESEGMGKGGDIDIQAESLSLRDGAFINTSTRGQGRGGNIRVSVSDFVHLSGVDYYGYTSELATSTLEEANGKAGDIIVNSPVLYLLDGATVNARTLGSSNGGNITINATTVEAVNGGQVLTTSLGRGQAGNIDLNVTDSVTLSGSDATYFERLARLGDEEVANAGPASGLFANTSETSTGQGGNLRINTGRLLVQDSARVTVSSEGTGNAGRLEVTSNDILLDNRGVLQATTSSGEGGNIELRSQDLILMRRGGGISTTAGLAGTGGNGGYININTQFLVAVPEENSDITANAFQGRGGTIQITARGIFGLTSRSFDELKILLGTDDPNQLDPARLPSSDITAISQTDPALSGQITLNTPDVDPSQGLATLPLQPVNPQVVQSCQPGGVEANNEFVVTGRGGLPPDAREIVRSEEPLVGLVTLDSEAQQPSSALTETNPILQTTPPIVEATGWIVAPNGEVVLVASASAESSWRIPVDCGVP